MNQPASRPLRFALSLLTLLTIVCLVSPVLVQAQSLTPDPYEPDEDDPPWIAEGEVQERVFNPDGDVDKARFRVKAGHWYEIRTQELAPLVDTVLTVEVAAVLYEDDDGGDEPLASRVRFQAEETTDAIITIVNSQGVYGPAQTYQLCAGEFEAPTPTATPSPTPTQHPTSTPTPQPTHTPPPTPTPAQPIISFSAQPSQSAAPGECVSLRWSVERATEVFLVYPNGNQEGVIGQDERTVCPMETSTYQLKVNALGGNETVEVEVQVPLPTHTPTPKPTRQAGASKKTPVPKSTLHVVVFVDENHNDAYDLQEGVLGAAITFLSLADPGQLVWAQTDRLGQAHFAEVPSGSYSLLIPHLGLAETVTLRGEEVTLDTSIPAIQLPSRIP